MDLSTRVLGTNVVTHLRERAAAVLLRIGRDSFDRAAFSHVACFNFAAAANLSALLNRELRVKDTRDLFERIPPALLAIPRLGSVSLAVLGAAFEIKKIGGDAPLEAWVRRHQDKDTKIVTFDSMKHHAADLLAARDERQRAAARTRGRRNQAHRLRVDRYTTRHGASHA